MRTNAAHCVGDGKIGKTQTMRTVPKKHAGVEELSLVPAYGKCLVKIGLSMALSPSCYGRIAPQSGLALKKFIDVGAGVIDADYRWEMGVILFNFGD